MKKSVILLFAMAIGLAAVSCENKDEPAGEASFLEVSPESISSELDGGGEGILISIKSNLSWTVSAEDNGGGTVDWLVISPSSGKGDGSVFCFILRGSKDAGRSCRIKVCSEDGAIVKTISVTQGKYVPTLVNVSLADVLKDASSQEVGVKGKMADYTQATVEVIGIPGDNLPEGYIFVTDGGNAWARMKTAQASTLHAGDIIKADLTGGTVTKEVSGGYTIDLAEQLGLVSSGTPSAAPKYVSTFGIPGYENMLVELRNVQATAAASGKAWSGDVTLLATDERDAEFTVHVNTGASLGNVGAGSGTVRGIVIDGKLCPRSAEDVSGLTNARIPAYKAPFQINPVINVIKNGTANNTLANGSIVGGTKLVFDDAPGYSIAGAAIEKVGGGSANKMTIAATTTAAPFNSCFTTIQWHLEGTYLLYTIPVKQKIYGDLEFAFAQSCGKTGVFTEVWSVSWSSDGVSFNPVDAVYCSDVYTEEEAAGDTYPLTRTNVLNNRQLAQFHIPESDALTSGNLYIKLSHPAVDESWSARTLRMNCGSVLSSFSPNTPVMEYDNILLMENFASCLYGHSPVIGIPTYHFTTYNVLEPGTTYSSESGWTVTGNSLASRGCLLLSDTGAANYIASPSLSALSVPSDITVRFKVAPFVDATAAEPVVNQNNIKVAVNGAGTVGEIQWDGDYSPYRWSSATVKISGAAASTQVLIGNIGGAADSRCYLDDIIISR